MSRRWRMPHRCGNRNTAGRCLARLTFEPRGDKSDPACPKCGSNLHWYVERHRLHRRDHVRQTCDDAACVYHHAHSKYSPLCVNNPRGLDEQAYDDALRAWEGWR